jgi:hypothetical protein
MNNEESGAETWIMKRIVGALLLLGVGAGCRDTAENLSRDYRNLINEAVDALMMVNSEAQAKMLTERVLKPYSTRIRGVNDRVKTWKQNAEKTDYGSQLFTSDSVVILMVENEMNQERLKLEHERIKKLVADMTKAEEETRRQAGDANPVTPVTTWPTLAALAEGKEGIEPIRNNLEQGTDVLAVLKEVQTDEKLLKDGRMMKLKESFDKKIEDFKKDRVVKIKIRL